MASCEGLGWGGGTTGGGVKGGGGLFWGDFGAFWCRMGWDALHHIAAPTATGGHQCKPPPLPYVSQWLWGLNGALWCPLSPDGGSDPPSPPPPPPLRENSHLFFLFFPPFFLQPFFFSSFYGKLRFTSLTFNGGSDLPSGTAGNGDIYWGRGGELGDLLR